MSDIRKRLVVALGGNAIRRPARVGDIDEQFAQVSETAEVLCDAIERGYQLIVTHGNGPQVGNILRRVESRAASSTRFRLRFASPIRRPAWAT